MLSQLRKLILHYFRISKGETLRFIVDYTAFQDKSPLLKSLAVRIITKIGKLSYLKKRNCELSEHHMQKTDSKLTNFPSLLQVEVTTYCNIKCRMCSTTRPVRKRNRKLQHIQMDVIESLKPALPYVSNAILQGGGEPFLHPKIEKIISIFQDYEVLLNTVTNGTVINENLAKLIGYNFSTLSVSIDGATAKTFELVRVGAKFSKVLQAVDLINKYRLPQMKLLVGFVIMRCNAHELAEMVKLSKKLGAQRFQAAWLVPFSDLPWSEEQDPTREPELMNQYLLEAYDVATDLGIELRLPPLLPTGRNFTSETLKKHRPVSDDLNPTNMVEGQCELMYNRATVIIDGDIKPCCHSKSIPDMGNVKDEDFRDIWNGTSYQDIRNTFNSGVLPSTCRSCNFIRSGQLKSAKLVVINDYGKREYLMPRAVS